MAFAVRSLAVRAGLRVGRQTPGIRLSQAIRTYKVDENAVGYVGKQEEPHPDNQATYEFVYTEREDGADRPGMDADEWFNHFHGGAKYGTGNLSAEQTDIDMFQGGQDTKQLYRENAAYICGGNKLDPTDYEWYNPQPQDRRGDVHEHYYRNEGVDYDEHKVAFNPHELQLIPEEPSIWRDWGSKFIFGGALWGVLMTKEFVPPGTEFWEGIGFIVAFGMYWAVIADNMRADGAWSTQRAHDYEWHSVWNALQIHEREIRKVEKEMYEQKQFSAKWKDYVDKVHARARAAEPYRKKLAFTTDILTCLNQIETDEKQIYSARRAELSQGAVDHALKTFTESGELQTGLIDNGLGMLDGSVSAEGFPNHMERLAKEYLDAERKKFHDAADKPVKLSPEKMKEFQDRYDGYRRLLEPHDPAIKARKVIPDSTQYIPRETGIYGPLLPEQAARLLPTDKELKDTRMEIKNKYLERFVPDAPGLPPPAWRNL